MTDSKDTQTELPFTSSGDATKAPDRAPADITAPAMGDALEARVRRVNPLASQYAPLDAAEAADFVREHLGLAHCSILDLDEDGKAEENPKLKGAIYNASAGLGHKYAQTTIVLARLENLLKKPE